MTGAVRLSEKSTVKQVHQSEHRSPALSQLFVGINKSNVLVVQAAEQHLVA
jgi:hypothetical protein